MMEILARYEAQGYEGQFAARPGERVMCFTCRKEHPAREVAMRALHRLEGTSNPDAMAAVAALTCPGCKAKGTLVVTYGPDAPVEEANALRLFRDEREQSSITPGK